MRAGQTYAIRALALLVLALLALANPARAADPDILWKIVSGQCVPAAQAGKGTGPCAAVDTGKGFAILKDINGVIQYLLISTAKVTGIEDPFLLDPKAPNYLSDAWQARGFAAAKAGRPMPRNVLSLTVNSAVGRTQNQLHVHISCLAAEVMAVLEREAPKPGTGWHVIKTPMKGQQYWAYGLSEQELAQQNGFKLVAAADPLFAKDMRLMTLAVAPVRDHLVLLADRADGGNGASAENLQDHACKVLN